MPPHSQKNQTIKQEQYCYKFNKNLKLVHIKNKKKVLKKLHPLQDHAQTKSQIPSNQVLHGSQKKPRYGGLQARKSQWFHL